MISFLESKPGEGMTYPNKVFWGRSRNHSPKFYLKPKKYLLTITAFDPPYCSYVTEEIITDLELDGLTPEEYAEDLYLENARDYQDYGISIKEI